jgi:hypothetical protein
MTERKSTASSTTRKPRATRYDKLDPLKRATIECCRNAWEKRHTGEKWTNERRDRMRAAVDEELTEITDAHRALVEAFRGACGVVKRRKDDPRVAALQEFLATVSDKTVSWLGHFADHMALGWDVVPKGRVRLVLYERSIGNDLDAGRLARLSLLLGNFPEEVRLPALVSEVVDRERKTMFQAIKRATVMEEKLTHVPSVFEPGKRVRIRSL